MDKNSFELIIFRQSRILWIAFCFPFTILMAIVLYVSIKIYILNLLATIIFLILISSVLVYFSIGFLKVTVNGRVLEFQWKRKLLFNYKDIAPIHLDDIETIVIDENKFLRKILTNEREIIINNGKILRRDIQRFINFLIRETDAKQIDSWDVWKERGWLKIAGLINLIVLISLVVIIITFIIVKGFKPKLLLFMPFILTQLLIYQSQINKKS